MDNNAIKGLVARLRHLEGHGLGTRPALFSDAATALTDLAAEVLRLRAEVERLTGALRLHVAYEAVPVDRGGLAGPKGKAWKAFIDARDAALASLESPK